MEKSAAELVDELNKTDESERVEAKACTSGNPGSAVLKTVSAFSNEPDLGGGFVVFGVTRQDDGNYKIAGVTDPDRLQTEFGSRCASDFNIRIRPSISVETVQGKTVIVAEIPEADPSKKPVYLKATGLPKGAYRRIGSADHRCTDDDVSQLYASSGSTSFDATVQERASFDEFDPSAIEDYRQTVRENGNGGEFLSWDDKKLMRSLRCLELSDSDELRPTVAGVLLFGAPVTLRRLFPSMYVDYIRVRGKEWVENPTQRYDDSQSIRKPLVQAVKRVSERILTDIPTPFSLNHDSFQRQDDPLIPAAVIRESVANALMHRSYQERGPIQVIRYDNRIEVRNPGHSLKPRDQLHEPGSNLRNPTIANVLREMGFAENKGSGIQAMRRLMKQAGLTPPTFDSDRSANRFVATFFLQHFLSDEELGWLDGVESASVDDKKALALVHVRETGRIDNARLRDLAGLDTLEASRCLRQLCDAGLLRMEGGGRSTFYSPGPDFPIKESTRESHKESHKKAHKKSHKKTGEHGESHNESQKDRLLGDLPESIASEIRHLTDRGNQDDIRQAILLACSNRKLSTRELSSLVGRERRYLLRTYVKPLIEDGELQREFPESPRHRNQTYFVPDSGQSGDSEDGQ